MSNVVINDKPWQQLLERAAKMRSVKAHVGVLASKGGSASHEGGDMSLVEIATVHEFGSPAAGVPERSFIRSTFFERKADALVEMCKNLVRAIVTDKVDVRRAVNVLGSWGAAEVKNTITQTDIPPPLMDATIAAKGSSKPLVDTGQLVNSITWEVVEE